jgi:ABC-type Fe3+/spermidine/putrescine transport system ATPase subunit
MSDRIAVMRSGKIEQLGTPASIYERPATRFVAGFIGSINMIAARVTRAANGAEGLAELDTPAGPARAATRAAAGSALTLTIRPERWRLGEAPADAIAWRATIERIVYLGARLELRLRLADGSPALAEAANDGTTAPREGESVTLWHRPPDSWVIDEG